jgi:uncharacterized protein DUF3606
VITAIEPRVQLSNSFGLHDPRVIDLDDHSERAYWLKVLEVSDDQLRRAIHDVGVSAQKVKDYLAAALDKASPDE